MKLEDQTLQSDKDCRETKIIDVAIPTEVRVRDEELEKLEKYKTLKDEISRMWAMKKVTVISVVAGTLGAITTGFEKFFEDIGI